MHTDAVIAKLRALAGHVPKFALLMDAISVYEKSGHQQVPDRSGWLIDRFPENDHGAIGAVSQMENSGGPGAAQHEVIAAQDNGLTNFDLTGRQVNLAAGNRQGVQRTLYFRTGNADGQNQGRWLN